MELLKHEAETRTAQIIEKHVIITMLPFFVGAKGVHKKGVLWFPGPQIKLEDWGGGIDL